MPIPLLSCIPKPKPKPQPLSLLLSHLSTTTTFTFPPSLPHLLPTHSLLITSGSISDRFYANNLISSYSKSGSLSLAHQLFDHTPHKDIITYNSLLSAYSHHHRFPQAFSLFRQILASSPPIRPTKYTFTPLLKLCSYTPNSVPATQALHCCTIRTGLDLDALVGSSLVGVYSKSGLVHDAKWVFDGMEERDVVLWNVMIKGYAQVGLLREAFWMFREMHRSEGLRPDVISVSCVLMGWEMGREWEQVKGYGVKASCFFEDFSDAICWNKRMSESVRDGRSGDALGCFVEMKRLGVGVDNVTFVVVLSAAVGGGNKCFELGKQVHGMTMRSGFCSDVSVSNNLINLYAKMGSLCSARRVFEEIEELDLVSWNSMISANIQNGLEEELINLFTDMMKYGVFPDEFTLTSILKVCSGNSNFSNLHKQIHCLIVKMGISNDTYLLTSLIDAYAKKGNLEEARVLYVIMDRFDLVALNALFNGYVANGDNYLALALCQSFHRNGGSFDDFTLSTVLKACSNLIASEQGNQVHAYVIKLGFDSDICVTSGILDMYIKCGNMKDAFEVFSDIEEPDDVAWTAMVSGCVENGDEDYALNIYRRMRQLGVLPDEFTLASVVKACSCLAALGLGKQIHASVIKLDHASDPFVETSIMDMYAKCGSIEDSYVLFKRTCLKNIASWNAMVLGFAQHGDGEKALNIFNEMISYGLRPDKITFVGVLSACSHSGLISEAYSYLDSMLKDYGIKPEIEHYSCLVDALGRGGLLEKAEEVIETMPFNASASMYRALLGACRNLRNLEIGQRLATKLLELEPQDSSAYVLLSNMYASSNQWENVTDARKSMKSKNVRKDPGYSWIEVRNKVHLFVVDDRSHPEMKAIYDKLEDLIRRIKDEGYVPDMDFALFDVEDEEKERSLLYHSEKLALSYGILSTKAPQTIRIIKNLRVCGDCHNAIKYISIVAGREIVLRDASRFHYFRDGVCSCGDYW